MVDKHDTHYSEIGLTSITNTQQLYPLPLRTQKSQLRALESSNSKNRIIIMESDDESFSETKSN